MAMNLSRRSESSESSPASPTPLHDTSAGSLSADETPRSGTPGSARRKNKRKMSEPRRLSDAKRARVDEEDSGVESTSAGSTDKSPVDTPGPVYPIMVPTYLPYAYPYMTPALGGLQAMQMINGQMSQLPVVSVPSTSAPVASTSKSKRDVRKEKRDRKSPPPQETEGSVCSDDNRQYKTMTVERRVEANARERTRVHTISAAFEALRRAVPAYSYNQKLSKLAILRIACCYILSLSRLADKDYSRDQSRPSFGECVDLTTRTIQAEGRAKKRH